MAKITDLPVASNLTGAEHLPIVQGNTTRRVTMAAFAALVTPFFQYWYRGDRGPAGPSNNTRASLPALRAASIDDQTSLFDGSLWHWVPGDASGKDDSALVVASDNAPLTDGAWKRRSMPIVAANPLELLATTQAYRPGSFIGTHDGFVYRVASPVASDFHLQTAGGMKLYVNADGSGKFPVAAFGVDVGRVGAASSNVTVLNRACATDLPLAWPAGDIWIDDTVTAGRGGWYGQGQGFTYDSLEPTQGTFIRLMG